MTRILTYALGLLLALSAPVVAQDDAGKSGGMLVDFLERTLSGDNRNIRVTGLEGALSSRATIRKLTVSDDDGVWLTINGAVLDWNRLALLRGRFSVNELSAEEIIVARRPNPPKTPPLDLPTPEAQPFSVPELPVSVEIGRIATGRLELGAALVGRPAALTLDGAMTLAEGSLDARLDARRLDRPDDLLKLVAGFSNATGLLRLDLDFHEDADGLVATALRIPGAPPARLTARGEGPVTDFRAEVALATSGQTRLSGQVALRGQPLPGAAEPAQVATVFSADLAGDLRPLMAERYRDFFGAETALILNGQRDPDGRLTVDRFELGSEALSLAGALTLDAEGAPERIRLDGSILPPQGQSVILPVPGAPTAVGALRLNGELDGTGSGSWRLSATLDDLVRADIVLGRATVEARGTIDLAGGGAVAGDLRAALRAVTLTDPALDRAVGDAITLDGGFSTPGDGTLKLSGLRLRGGGLDATVDGTVDGFDSGFRLTGNATVAAADIGRFSGLAGRRLGGAIEARLEGTGAPLGGQFDLRLDAVVDALETGLDRLDPLLAGRTALALDAARGAAGLDLRHLSLVNEAVTTRLDGKVRSHGTDLTFDFRLDDLARVLPEARGPLTASGDIAETGGTWRGKVRVDGPTSSHAEIGGSFATASGDIALDYDARIDRIERFVSELTGTVTSSGRASRTAGLWTIDGKARGPAGIDARVSGTWNQASNRADLTAKGSLRLAVANRFISPMSASGGAQFDLALKGPPSLDALSGRITASGVSVAVPQVANSIQDLGGTVTLANRRAQLALTGGLRAGGQFSVSGPVALTAPFDGRLDAELRRIVLTDHVSYETTADGQLVYAGPVTGNGQLSGRVLFGETNINIAAAGGGSGAAPIPEMHHLAEPAAVRATRARAGLISTGNGGPAVNIGLDLKFDAPNRVFVRGRGLNAELGGSIIVRGNSANVVPSGQIGLIRGVFDIFGRRLELTKGEITLQGRLEPYIDFQAQTNTGDGQATLEITGPLTAPEIDVSSSPARPTEEALAMLVFGNQYSKLSPLKIAQLASSFAQLAGSGGGGLVDSARQGLGVDSLDIGTDDNGAARVGVGAYVADNVYTDVSVNIEGKTELSINLDLTDSLTARGSVTSSGSSSIGLFFQKDY